MGVVHRTIFTWFTILMFLVLLVLRIDNRTQWNWFVVFIPLWVFNAILLIYATFRTTSDCKNRSDHAKKQRIRDVVIIVSILLMVVFEILLCLKLEYPSLNLPLAYVMIPFWIDLVALLIRVFVVLYHHSIVMII